MLRKTIRNEDSRYVPARSEMEVLYCGMTDVGRRRNQNDDHFMIADMHKNMHVCESSLDLHESELFGAPMGKMMLVADGIGGARAGRVASEMAIQEMARFLLNSMHWLFNPKQPEVDQFVEDLKLGALRSHSVVRTESETNPDRSGMGTTLTAAFILWPMLYVVHVGDSRCYILRDGSLTQLTRDQTLAQMLYENGQINQQEFESSPYQNVLISAIGTETEPDVLVYKTRLKPLDRILLCSDGVNVHLSDDEIESTLGAHDTPRDVCQNLIAKANEKGGVDNITAVVAFNHHST